ncbi:MAG: hypothetical protein IPG04_14680 [Polyangiaceae bacterium]|nr:hypothetical protein [Polyangiaceae bacterium]
MITTVIDVIAAAHRALGEALRAQGVTAIVRPLVGVIVETVDGPRTIVVMRYAQVWRLRLDGDVIRRPRAMTLVESPHPPLEVTCSAAELLALVGWAAGYIVDARAVFPVALEGPLATCVWTRRAVAEYEPTAANRRAAVDS